VADKAEVKKGEKYTVNVGPETRKRIDKLVNEAAGTKRAGGPSFREVAKG
jgi:hypothetical protein